MSGKNPFLGMGFSSPFASFVGSASGASSNLKIVVGANGDDDGGSASGSAYIYNLDGTGEVKLTASDGAASDQFGISVAIAHNKIVVGSSLDDENGNYSGSVYLYNLDGTGETKITASDASADDRFGWSVAMGNNKIAVGALMRDVGTLSGAGSVYIYDLDGNEVGIITASDASADDRFGSSVAIAHNKIVVGSYLDDPPNNSGSIYVYDLDGTNEVKITASDAADSDLNGYSVAIGSNKIVAGAYGNDDGGSASGSVYVYDLDGTNEVKITASDATAGDYFGLNVAVGHNKIVVGATGDDDNGNQSGSVYLYNLDGTGEVKLTPSDGVANERFGASVAIAHNKLVVGTQFGNSSTGSVYVYNLDGTGETKITASDGAASDYFGRAVALG